MRAALLLLAIGAPGLWLCHALAPALPVKATLEAAALPPSGRIPARFVPNLGQWDESVRFVVLGDTTGWLHDDGFSLRFERWSDEDRGSNGRPTHRQQHGCVVRSRFATAGDVAFTAGPAIGTMHHFLRGADPQRWRRDVPGFATVTAHGVLPGIDVHFRPLPDGRRGPFEYDVLLAPGAELERFVVDCEGIDHLRIDAGGCLVATFTLGGAAVELVQEAPVAWQQTAAGPQPLAVSFRLLGPRRYGFTAAERDPGLPAVIDPGIVWGSFLGGGASDNVFATAWRPGVGVWVAGWSGSTDFPTTAGAFQTQGGADAFLARLTPDGQGIVFATYLGGSLAEEARGLALGPGDTPTVVGFTRSLDFPCSPGALQTTYSGGSPFLDIGDAFVARLSADGGALLASTYLGGAFDDVAEAVVVDNVGNAIVAGWTSSADLPLPPGGFQPALGGPPILQSDGFVCVVAASGQSILAGTWLGGSFSDQLLAIDRDPLTGQIAVAGWTQSLNFPATSGAFATASAGGIDGVVARFDASLATALFCTHVGGAGEDVLHAVRFGPDGVWAGGATSSSDFPTTANALQSTNAGGTDAALLRLSADGAALPFATLLGGPGPDRIRALAVAAQGVLAVGEAGPMFPVTADAAQAVFASGVLDAFATLVAPGTAGVPSLAWSTYLGGSGQDSLFAAELADNGLAVVAGSTFSPDFPLGQAGAQGQMLGVRDGVVLQLDVARDLGGAVAVQQVGDAGAVIAAPGPIGLLAVELVNTAGRPVVVDGVRILVEGAGDPSQRLSDLRAHWTAGSAVLQVAALSQLAANDFELQLDGAQLPAAGAARLALTAVVAPDPDGATVEVAIAVPAAAAWRLRAPGAGAGPEVRVDGSGRAEGPIHIVGALPGDADRDGLRTVVDLRRLVNRIGSVDRAIDADGDGVLSTVDLDANRAALLGRATVFSPPAAAPRGTWLVVPCLLPRTAGVEASLGGRPLVLGRATPRRVSVFVAADQPTGVQELVLTASGIPFFQGALLVP